MNSPAELLASFFVNSFWQVAAVGAAGWAASRLLKCFGPRLRHLLWVTTLGLAVIVPVLPLLRSVLASRPFLPTAQSHSVASSVFDQQPVGNNLVLPPASIRTFFVLFLVALAWSTVRFAWSLRSTITLRREAYPVSFGIETEQLWTRCKNAFSVKEVQVLCSESINGPVTIGFARPTLLVSGEFVEKCESHDLLAALAHECAHIKRRDFQKNLLYEVGSLAVAYHPVIWFVKSQIARTREMICDDMVTEKVMERHSYAESLLRLARMIAFLAPALTSNAIGIFDGDILEERIMTMKRDNEHFGSNLKYAVTAGSLLLLLASAGGIGVIARPIEAQSQSGSSNSASAKTHVDLACTYYDRGQGVDGTCETHKGDKTHYYCAANHDMNLSQEQSGCEWKVQRAKALKQRVPEK